MKIASLKNPVRLSWLIEERARLDAPPFLADSLRAKFLLNRSPIAKDRLDSLTSGHDGGIYNGPMFSRTYVEDQTHGVPFMGSSDMLQADLGNLPLLSRRAAFSPRLRFLRLEEGMTLISCSGTIGRTVYVRRDMAGMWSSQHVMKVVPDVALIRPGYLYAFLSSKFGRAQITGGTYGAIIQHIEAADIAGLLVPRLGGSIEQAIDELVTEAAALRAEATVTLKAAVRQLEEAAALPQLESPAAPTPFSISSVRSTRAAARLDGFFHSAYHAAALSALVDARGGVCRVADGIAESIIEPVRFKRVPLPASDFGLPFFGTSAIMRIDPEPSYYVSRRIPDADSYVVKKNTVLVPRSGQVSGIIGEAVLPYGGVLGGAVTEDAIRINCSHDEIAGYVFVALKSEYGRRQLKARAYGSSIPHLDVDQIGSVLIPRLASQERKYIGMLGAKVADLRDRAVSSERLAVSRVEAAMEELS